MRVFERNRRTSVGRLTGSAPVHARGRARSPLDSAVNAAGYSLTELLVVMAIILTLTSLAAAGVSAATGSQKRYRTAALIGKLDTIIATQYAEYASRNVDVPTGGSRSAILRAIASGDLPDTWTVVSSMATRPDAELTPHQRAYKAIWNSILDSDKARIALTNASAECLFMIVMQGGVADCLDCRLSRIDVGDQDGDNMPEFLDAWGSPIAFVFQPSGLKLPAGSSEAFFSSAEPFSATVPSLGEGKGGLIRPLIFSAGPDRSYGLLADAAAIAGDGTNADNITNFDEEAKR